MSIIDSGKLETFFIFWSPNFFSTHSKQSMIKNKTFFIISGSLIDFNQLPVKLMI